MSQEIEVLTEEDKRSNIRSIKCGQDKNEFVYYNQTVSSRNGSDYGYCTCSCSQSKKTYKVINTEQGCQSVCFNANAMKSYPNGEAFTNIVKATCVDIALPSFTEEIFSDESYDGFNPKPELTVRHGENYDRDPICVENWPMMNEKKSTMSKDRFSTCGAKYSFKSEVSDITPTSSDFKMITCGPHERKCNIDTIEPEINFSGQSNEYAECVCSCAAEEENANLFFFKETDGKCIQENCANGYVTKLGADLRQITVVNAHSVICPKATCISRIQANDQSKNGDYSIANEAAMEMRGCGMEQQVKASCKRGCMLPFARCPTMPRGITNDDIWKSEQKLSHAHNSQWKDAYMTPAVGNFAIEDVNSSVKKGIIEHLVKNDQCIFKDMHTVKSGNEKIKSVVCPFLNQVECQTLGYEDIFFSRTNYKSTQSISGPSGDAEVLAVSECQTSIVTFAGVSYFDTYSGMPSTQLAQYGDCDLYQPNKQYWQYFFTDQLMLGDWDSYINLNDDCNDKYNDISGKKYGTVCDKFRKERIYMSLNILQKHFEMVRFDPLTFKKPFDEYMRELEEKHVEQRKWRRKVNGRNGNEFLDFGNCLLRLDNLREKTNELETMSEADKRVAAKLSKQDILTFSFYTRNEVRALGHC